MSAWAEIALDVRNEASCRAAVDEMERRFGGVDVLVANAGVSSSGAFEETPIEEFRRVMDVNFLGAVRITQATLPKMRDAGGGHIVAISSLSALIGLPGDSAYSASKHALEGAFEALAAEVSRFGVSVALVEPGGVATEFMNEAFTGSSAPGTAYQAFNDAMCARTRNKSGADPRAIAEEIVSIIETPGVPLRRPVGDQARAVVSALRDLTGQARAKFAERAAGLEWWSKGAASPTS